MGGMIWSKRRAAIINGGRLCSALLLMILVGCASGKEASPSSGFSSTFSADLGQCGAMGFRDLRRPKRDAPAI